jgi:5,10-methylenetetrahydromethanopterin reductase
MRIGVWTALTQAGGIDEMVATAKRAEAQGFASLWVPQVFGGDALTALAIAGRETTRIELGTSVVPTYPRHPMAMAEHAMTVQAASHGRLCLGLGLSHQVVIEGMYGYSFDKPARHMREYLTILQSINTTGSAAFAGETMKGFGTFNVGGHTPFPVVIAALAPRMLELAGTLADGTLTWCTGPATLADYIVPGITAAADKAGKSARVIASLPVCVTSDLTGAYERAATMFSIYGQLPSYRAMLDREGAGIAADIAITGTKAHVQDRIMQLRDIGVTDFAAVEFGGTPDEQAETREAMVELLAF